MFCQRPGHHQLFVGEHARGFLVSDLSLWRRPKALGLLMAMRTADPHLQSSSSRDSPAGSAGSLIDEVPLHQSRSQKTRASVHTKKARGTCRSGSAKPSPRILPRNSTQEKPRRETTSLLARRTFTRHVHCLRSARNQSGQKMWKSCYSTHLRFSQQVSTTLDWNNWYDRLSSQSTCPFCGNQVLAQTLRASGPGLDRCVQLCDRRGGSSHEALTEKRLRPAVHVPHFRSSRK